MSGDDQLLPDADLGGVKTKKILRFGDVPADDIGSDSGTDTETDCETTDSDSDSEFECKVCDKKFQDYIQFKQHKKGKKHAKMLSKKKMVRKLSAKDDKSDGSEQDDEHLIPEPFATCKVCNKEFPGPQAFHLHLRSKTHKHKALESYILEQVSENGEVDADKLVELYNKIKQEAGEDDAKGKARATRMVKDEGEKIHEEFECKECEKVFSGLTPYTQHLMSKTHAKQVDKKKILHDVLSEEPPDGNTASDKTKHKDLSSLSLEDDILVCKSCSTSFNGPESAMMHLKSKNHAKKLDKYIRKMERKNKKKEAKGSGSGDKEVGDQPGKEVQEDAEAPKEEHQPTSEPSSTTDAVRNSSESEASNLTASGDKIEELKVYEKYKNYKGLMNSLPLEDVMLK